MLTVRFTRMGRWVGGAGLGAAMNRSRTVGIRRGFAVVRRGGFGLGAMGWGLR